MLKWLRSSGDKVRLDQEITRLGARPSALPEKMREQLVQVVQVHIDLARTGGQLSTAELQAFFDMSFELAAAVPMVTNTPRDLATETVGENGYNVIIELMKAGPDSIRGNLVKDLYKASQDWVKHKNSDFDEALASDSEFNS